MQNSRWAGGHGPGASRETFNRQSPFGAPAINQGQGHTDYRVDMGVCKFYLNNACKFGESCKNEHPGSARDGNRGGGGSSFGGGSSNNRFSAFNGDRYRPAQDSGSTTFGGARDSKTPDLRLDKDVIKADLTTERPVYPLSCYSPHKDAPRQLIEGPVEISPEELRLRYYTLRGAGNEPQAQQEEGALNEKMQQQVKAIVDDVAGAIRYVEEGANVHPNRVDMAKGSTTAAPADSSSTGSNPFMKAPANPFQTASSAQPSAFGQASTPGFGKPAFGQPSNPVQTPSPFGQASNPGQGTSAFGQPSNPGQAAAPFGASSALGQKPSPFGQASALGGASAFGKPAFGASGFGQASVPGTGSAFGQASSVGQGSAFGQASAPGAASGFGQANSLGQKPNPFSKPGFGTSGFGQAAQPGATASPFGQQAAPSSTPFGQQAQSNASPFGQQAQPGTSPFGQQASQTAQASPFGQAAQPGTQPSPFGQAAPPTTNASPFGQAAQQAPKPNPFAQGQTQQPAAQANPFGGAAPAKPSAFGQPSKPSPFGTTQQPQNTATQPQAANPFLKPAQTTSPSPFGTQNGAAPALPQAALQPTSTAFAPAPREHSAGVTPDGKPIDPKDRYKEGKPEEYDGEQGKILEEIYKRVSQLGRFNDDEDIPVTPPKCEWIAPLVL